jgi:hypothetical protein
MDRNAVSPWLYLQIKDMRLLCECQGAVYDIHDLAHSVIVHRCQASAVEIQVCLVTVIVTICKPKG